MRTLSIALATSLFLGLAATPAEAAREDVEITNLRAKLTPGGEPIPDELEGMTEEGQAWLRLFTRGERTREQFHVGVEIPLDTLGIATLEELEALTVEFSVKGVVVCTLAADTMDLLEDKVEFAADVRTRNGEFLRELGDCGGAIPAIAQDDSASVQLDGAPLLEGVFELRERGGGRGR